MDTLALVAVTMGLVAAIGVVVVAMREKGTEAAQPEAGQPASPSPTQEQATAAPAGPSATPPAPRRKRQHRHAPGAPAGASATPITAYHGRMAAQPPLAPLAMPGADPLLIGLGQQLQLLNAELQKLRQQEEETVRRLKLIDEIALLLQETEGGHLNGRTPVSSSPDR